MRRLKAVLFLAGVAVLVVLVVRIGWEPIESALARLTWWQFALICLPYAAIMVLDTFAWRYAFTRPAAPFHRLLGARIAGEAVNLVTATGSVGGEAVKAWLVRRDVPYEESVPAVVIAKTTITIAQALFLCTGIALASLTLTVHSQLIDGMLWLLGVEVLAVGGFFGAQVTGWVARAGRLLTWCGVVDDAAYTAKLDVALRGYYRTQWRRLTLSVGFHYFGWVLGALETFIILRVLDVPSSLLLSTVIEALGSGVRFATFLVPASLGAFEGANAAAFAALGLGASTGLAYSLVRRARQIVWIAIGIVILVAMRSSGWARRATGAAPGRRVA